MTAKELFRPGEQCGEYCVERELGRGGMGCVYLARSAAGRPVALKTMLLSVAAKSTSVERFQQEARIIALIQHTHLIQFIEAGRHESVEHGTILWIALEYLEGPTLRQVLDEERRIDVDDALRWCAQIADALSAAGSVKNCGACSNDAQCKDGACIPLDFNKQPHGYFCLKAANPACQQQPFDVFVTKQSISGKAAAKYCGIDQDQTTCEAVNATLAGWVCSGTDGKCGPQNMVEVSVPGALCRTVGVPNRCTYPCTSALQCLSAGT